MARNPLDSVRDAKGRFKIVAQQPAWQTWTPTVTQSGAVSVTVLLAEYKLDYRDLCYVRLHLRVTGTGTISNIISVGGQPAAIQALYSSYSTIGVGHILDTGTAIYSGAVISAGATAWYLYCHNTANAAGVEPAFALAVNDEISYMCTYRV